MIPFLSFVFLRTPSTDAVVTIGAADYTDAADVNDYFYIQMGQNRANF